MLYYSMIKTSKSTTINTTKKFKEVKPSKNPKLNREEIPREAIDKLSNDMDDNTDAWAYRGGFYTNPIDGETTPYCRHIWKSVIKARKK